MNVLSLFDGCAMARVALDRLGITPDRYIASEIDKYAIRVAKKNYPDIEEIGDVQLINPFLLPDKIDLLIGGSPCQGFSSSGKRRGLNDDRSKLFYEYVRILKDTKPKYFLLENVASMRKDDRDTITTCLIDVLYPPDEWELIE